MLKLIAGSICMTILWKIKILRCIYCINKFSNTAAFIDQLFFPEISFHCQQPSSINCFFLKSASTASPTGIPIASIPIYSHWDPQNGACKSNSKESNYYPICYKSTTICLFFKFLRNFIIFCSAIIVLGSLYAWENHSSYIILRAILQNQFIDLENMLWHVPCMHRPKTWLHKEARMVQRVDRGPTTQ